MQKIIIIMIITVQLKQYKNSIYIQVAGVIAQWVFLSNTDI